MVEGFCSHKGHYRPPAMRIKESRFRVVALCFLLLVSLSTTTVVQSSETTTSTSTTSQVSSNDVASKAGSLFESLWASFKQTLEQTSLSSAGGRKRTAIGSQQQQQQTSSTPSSQSASTTQNSPPISSRRTIFLEQSLHQHYTEQLLSEYEGRASDDDTGTAGGGKRREEGRLDWQSRWEHPLRWHYNRCYYYTETAEAYWTFQWCPGGTIEQGFRTRQLKMNSKHVLGKYVRPATGTTTSNPEGSGRSEENLYDTRFYLDVRQRFPRQTVQLYTGGDECAAVSGEVDNGDGDVTASSSSVQIQRIAAVVLHQEESTRCPKSITKGMATPLIESIEESQTCQYIMHVCLPTSGDDLSASEVDDDFEDDELSRDFFEATQNLSVEEAKQMNSTLHHIKKLMHTYLHRNQATQYQKMHPDRTTSLHVGLPPLPPSRIKHNLGMIRDMFTHAYDSYMYNAYPASEIRPMSCKPAAFHLVRIPALTLLDSLDMLVVLGNYTEFARSVERLRGLHSRMAQDNAIFDHMHEHQGGLFALNQNVSVFETNIRILGGLLSAHQLAEAFLSKNVYYEDVYDEDGNVLIGPLAEYECVATPSSKVETITIPSETCGESSLHECPEEDRIKTPPPCQNRTAKYWHYNGFLLDLAQDIGNRLLPAFETKTGIPFGSVNLLHGIPKGETTIASLAGAGTLSLEMELLSRLTGRSEYGRAAKLSARALWMRRSDIDLLGKHLCTHRGEWTESLSGVGSNSDSFYEYLTKHHILFPEDQDFWFQAVAAYGGVFNESRLGEWYGDVEMGHGSLSGGAAKRVFEALMAFYPGMQVLMGELGPAARTLNSFFMVREFLGFLPERFNYAYWKVDSGGGKHFLRPELLESAYFLHRATKGFQHLFRRDQVANQTLDSSGWQWAVDFSLHTLEQQTRTTCGYASLREVAPTSTGAVAEQDKRRNQIKLMDDMPSFFLSETLKYLYLTFDETNVIHADPDREWIFTTEAHPIHYVPKQRQHESTRSLRSRLKNRLKSRIEDRQDPDAFDSWRFLVDEKWSEASSFAMFAKRIDPILHQVGRDSLIKRGEIEGYANYHVPSEVVSTFLGPEQIFLEFDFFNETEHETNQAHLTFSKEGFKRQIARSCPNFYSSDLLWVRALNGGSADYADAYISTARDEVGESNSRFHMLGSIEALSIEGSGRHVADVFDFSNTCTLGEKPPTPVESEENKKQDGKERFALGGELGTFDVSVFPGGSGFLVQHVESGEAISATVVDDEFLGQETVQSFVMIQATPATQGEADIRITEDDVPWNSKIGTILKLDEEILKTTDYEPLPGRAVALSDLKGNSYSCKVEILHRTGKIEKVNQVEDEVHLEDETEILVTYPCAPALFGPTHLSGLNESVDGIVIEQEVRAPEIGDEYGCVKDVDGLDDDDESPSHTEDETAEVCEKKVVQILSRGVCTFQEKARNQQRNVNAEAVIMINNEPDELFIMSGATDEDPDHDQYPVTVLLTGDDGHDLLELLDTVEEEGGLDLTARVSLKKQTAKVIERNGKFVVSGNNHNQWPVVRASEQAVQIFSRGGWGCHALQRPPKPNQSHAEWQLYLMRFQTE